MPYYHNFGWYYFAKYILGLAGMIYLYTGILKEKSIVCVCPAEERELDRRKEPNNECSPTGDLTDVPAKARCCPQTVAHVGTESVRCPELTRRRSHVDKSVGTSRKNLRQKCSAHENVTRRENLRSISSSDKMLKIRDSDEQSQNYSRRLKCQRNRKDSSTNTKSAGGFEMEKKKDETRSILDAVAGANFRVRNSFAEQENLELEAFVRSIVDHEISRRCFFVRENISSSEVNSTTEMENSEDEEVQNSSSEKKHFSKHRTIRRRVNQPLCKKHFPRSPTTSLTSVRSRSGTLYFTASSRGKKRPECKIHGNRFRNKIEYERAPQKIWRPRIIEHSDESDNEKKIFCSTGHRRKISSRRITRYRSSVGFT